ncbi:hypothetical protein BN7_960 [Wickerhamomyces ciferrii]|uniref:Uncharacterized protein n=1 Tax=Wickerhamomyces ciferrii (strain ATCC 14091 / BCRC 22168 / CBS 111 / JCM 3599 / NBRC 0793 / NRRL Y-1031 F-60-10) TaxID=1206466 RepID=K0KIZ3_WICCF|nr:uncharacterized protein BN7_960 [Wickerhamomyces ciferrii]CCH41419.1 hypothetical protein BN7_960 [Wickerhamomyces ciferrii]
MKHNFITKLNTIIKRSKKIPHYERQPIELIDNTSAECTTRAATITGSSSSSDEKSLANDEDYSENLSSDDAASMFVQNNDLVDDSREASETTIDAENSDEAASMYVHNPSTTIIAGHGDLVRIDNEPEVYIYESYSAGGNDNGDVQSVTDASLQKSDSYESIGLIISSKYDKEGKTEKIEYRDKYEYQQCYLKFGVVTDEEREKYRERVQIANVNYQKEFNIKNFQPSYDPLSKKLAI